MKKYKYVSLLLALTVFFSVPFVSKAENCDVVDGSILPFNDETLSGANETQKRNVYKSFLSDGLTPEIHIFLNDFTSCGGEKIDVRVKGSGDDSIQEVASLIVDSGFSGFQSISGDGEYLKRSHGEIDLSKLCKSGQCFFQVGYKSDTYKFVAFSEKSKTQFTFSCSGDDCRKKKRVNVFLHAEAGFSSSSKKGKAKKCIEHLGKGEPISLKNKSGPLKEGSYIQLSVNGGEACIGVPLELQVHDFSYGAFSLEQAHIKLDTVIEKSYCFGEEIAEGETCESKFTPTLKEKTKSLFNGKLTNLSVFSKLTRQKDTLYYNPKYGNSKDLVYTLTPVHLVVGDRGRDKKVSFTPSEKKSTFYFKVEKLRGTSHIDYKPDHIFSVSLSSPDYRPGEEVKEKTEITKDFSFNLEKTDVTTVANIINEIPNFLKGDVKDYSSKGFIAQNVAKGENSSSSVEDAWKVLSVKGVALKKDSVLAEVIDTTKNPFSDSKCFDKEKQEIIEGCYEFLAPIPGLEGSGIKSEDGYTWISNITVFNLADYLNTLFRLAISILIVIAVLMLMVAGVEYMTTESLFGKSQAKSRIQNAIGGLFLALGTYLILNTINPNILDLTAVDKLSVINEEGEVTDAALDPNYDPAKDPSDYVNGTLFRMPSELRGLFTYYKPKENRKLPLEKRRAIAANLAAQFKGKTTYRFGGKGGNLPEGKAFRENRDKKPPKNFKCKRGNEEVRCGDYCPAGTICLDCSGFVSHVLYGSGLVGFTNKRAPGDIYRGVSISTVMKNPSLIVDAPGKKVQLKEENGKFFIKVNRDSKYSPNGWYELKTGDILYSPVNHMAMYLSGGFLAESSPRGGGRQAGKGVAFRKIEDRYQSFPFKYVFPVEELDLFNPSYENFPGEFKEEISG